MLTFYFGFDREPMNSWIMKQWLKTHNKEEYPDLSITQGNDAFHVLEESCHPPEESIERMCSPEFFSKHKYKYVESPMNIKLDQTFEDCGNSLASPLYEEPVLRHSQACVGKIVARNKDIALDYAYPMNEEGYESKRSPPFSIHNKNQTSIPMGTEHQCPRENRGNQVDMTEKSETESNQSKTESQEQEGDEEYIDGANAQSSDLEHNENATLEEPPKQDQKAAKNALGKDNVNITYASLTIHDKKPTRMANKEGYQSSLEHGLNQADLTEKGETQSYQSRKTKSQHEREQKEEVIYEFITQSSDREHNENATLEEAPKQDQKAAKNALGKDNVNITYASLTIHDKKPTRMANKEGYQSSLEHGLNQADLTEKGETQSYQSRKTKSQHEREQKEEVIYEFITQSSDREHNENATLEEAPKQDQKAAKNALGKDNVNITYAFLTIHDKKPTRMANKEGYQSSLEHGLNQADLTEKGETQSYQPRKTKSQHEREQKEEVIYEFITQSSDREHNENATLEEAPKQDQKAAKNALGKDNVKITYASLTIHDKKPTRMANKGGYQSSLEHGLNQADLTEKGETQSYQPRKTKSQHEREQKEEVIYEFITQSSDREHNENATLEEAPKQDQKAAKNALGKDNVNITYASLTIHDKMPTRMAKKETRISKEVWKKDEKAVTHASVEEAETTKYQSLTVHFKELTGVPKEIENQCPREHCGYEAPLTERGKTESKRSKTKTKFQPIHEDDEGDINGCIAISFRNSQEEQVDANGNKEDEEEIARLEEICNHKEKVSQEGTVRIKYPQEDGSGALRKDTPMTHTLRTDKIKEEDQEAQNLQPVGDGTECKVDHQPSRLRRTKAIRRKTKSSETKKLAMRKANNKQNKEKRKTRV